MGPRLFVCRGSLGLSAKMNRTFLSLYLLIALGIALAGWGLDKLWQHFSPPPAMTTAQQDLVLFIESAVINQTTTQIPRHLQTQITFLTLEDFAHSSLRDALADGETVTLHDRKGELQIYKLARDNHTIIRLQQPVTMAGRTSHLNTILLILFYASIGLVIYVWLWPLMRDVRKLERHTQHVGQNQLPEPVSVLPGSAVTHLATAFNKMAERIRELLASHKEMTYAVSHELRTPLARMKFALAMLKSDSTSAQHTASLAQDIEEMEALITQLLTYAGYEQESGPLTQKDGDMAFFVQELITRAKQSNPNRDVQVDLVCDQANAHMQCDWHLMDRAIFNLIHNAFRFAHQKILVEFAQTDGEFIITVSDDGQGIIEADRERVFESFVRLNTKPNAQVRGFGLGLAIVKRVMKWHLGSASVEKASIGGAKFILRWPKVKMG